MKWWQSNSLEAQLHQLDISIAGGRKMQALTISKHVHRHRTTALLDESISSAQLAGINVSKKAAKEMLLKKRPPQNTDEQICVNIYRTLQNALAKKEEEMNETLFLQLHQTLTKDTIKLKGIGHYRTNNKVDISSLDLSSGYKILPIEKASSLMSFVFNLYNNDKEPFFIHPLVKAAIIHYLIVFIRPFKDGNGRIARILAFMYLLKKDYWVAEFFSISNIISKIKSQYHKAITISQTDNQNIGYFIQFYIQSIQIAYKSLHDFVKRISRESSETVKTNIPGYNERQTAILKWIKDDPQKLVSIREVRSVYGVSKETARTDLNGLVAKGWIRYFNINKKAYAFVKDEGFDSLMKEHG